MSNVVITRQAMKILYISRHFNRSGYYILKELIELKYNIIGIVLKNEADPMKNIILRPFAILKYYIKCLFYQCRQLRFLKSEELLAKSNGIPIIKINDIKTDEFLSLLNTLMPDIIVLGGGWHQLLPPHVYNFPKRGTINTHPSLLPKFRGTAVHRWQVLHGENESGVTIHYVDETFDTGSIIAQKKVEILETDTPQELFEKTAIASGPLMREVLDRIIQSPDTKIQTIDQKHCEEHYFHRWLWDDAIMNIDWNNNFLEIYRLVLASTQESYEYKGPIFSFAGSRYFLRRAIIITNPRYNKCGNDTITLMKIDGYGMHLYRETDDRILIVNQVQLYDDYYKIRRGFNPRRLAKQQSLEPGSVLNSLLGVQSNE
jgi:methionyl-tRNA formyltransferase